MMKSARALVAIVILGACAVAAAVWWRQDSPEGPAAPPRANQPTPVVVAQARYDTFAERIEALGTTAANEAVVVTSKVTGRIMRIGFEDGGTVERGVVLVELDDEEEKAALAAAEANLTTQRAQHRRLQDLVRQRSAAQTTLDEQANLLKAAEAQLEIARVRLRERTIRAPFGGQLGIRRVSPGALVNPNDVIVTLDDLSLIKLDFSVPETVLASIRPGLDIEAASVAYPDRRFRGVVTTVGSRVDPVTRSVVVRAELPNPDGVLRPGMLMTVALIRDRSRSLVIPEEGLIPRDDRHYVYRITAGGTVERVEVAIGRRRPGEVEILGGLQEGDTIVVEGTTRVDPGAAVRAVQVQGRAGPDFKSIDV